ncbi:crotonase/enoyl-CoA hydratase family protein [Donghicola sp. XS_ASV15]|uniref:crotonase/enoyl-CoA hydratase family protein n=1 Tax=Donghicola sp. XS_ASV15 TaxID=3241295 RepID=UPI0035134618
MPETIRIDQDDRGVATIWLTRTGKHNAMSALMMDELHHAATSLGDDNSVRVVILSAEGKSFCAGGDLDWMRDQFDADAATRLREARRLADMLMALDRLPKPLIGRLQGNAFGGGVGLASVCDCAIGADHIHMGLTEVKLGLIPATIGPYVIARMGAARARRVFFQGRVFDAQEAVRLGLLAREVPLDTLEEAVEAEVAPYLSAAPGAVAKAKALVRELGGGADQTQVDASVAALAEVWAGTESSEGIAAFFDKRPAAWTK